MQKGLRNGEVAFNTADEGNEHGLVELQKVHYDWERKYLRGEKSPP